MPEGREFFKLSSDGVLSAGTGKDRWQAPHSGEITNVVATVGVAPATTPITIDVNKNGTTIYTTQANRPVVPAGALESVDATVAKPDVQRFDKGDTISIDLDTVGTTTTGTDLDVTVEYVQI